MEYQRLPPGAAEDVEKGDNDRSLSWFRMSSTTTFLHFVVLYSTVGLLAVGLTAEIKGQFHVRSPALEVYSPANEAVRYHRQRNEENNFLAGSYNGYMVSRDTGLPTRETDELWSQLYNIGPNDHTVGPLGISAAQAHPLESPTVQAADSPAFVIQLEVFHQLHCLNVLRRTLYLDHYLATGNPADRALFGDYLTADGQRNYTSWSGLHQDHCIDALRQAIMCHGDATAISWQWNPTKMFPMPSFQQERECVDYSRLKDWAFEHHISNDKVSLEWGVGPEERLTYSREDYSAKREDVP